MTNTNWALELVEQTEKDNPHCALCGAPTVPVAADDGGLWLRCSSAIERKSLLRRLFSLDFAGGHTKKLIIQAISLDAA
jgi:hypothetical protein